MEQKLQERAEEYARVLTQAQRAAWRHAEREMFLVQEHSANQKYVRIIEDMGTGRNGSVHSFICTETGGVHKAGGWSSPARDRNGKVYPAKYNLLDDESFAALLFACVNTSGGYLYANAGIPTPPVDKTINDVIREIEETRIAREDASRKVFEESI